MRDPADISKEEHEYWEGKCEGMTDAEKVKILIEALRCYVLNYPCPGFEVGLGAGETSSCNGSGGDCPTCEATKL